MDAGNVLRTRDAFAPESLHQGSAIAIGIELDDVDEPGATVLRIVRLGGILDQHQAVTLCDCPQLVELARISEHVHSDDRARALRDRRLDGTRIHVQRHGIDVGEDGSCALENEAVRGSHERHRGRDRLVSGAEPGDLAEELEPSGPARERRGIGSADAVRDLLFEPVDPRTERQAPGPQHLEDELLLSLAEPRPGEWNLPDCLCHAWALAGSIDAYSSQCAHRSLWPRTVSR